jgi:hypothetical protein
MSPDHPANDRGMDGFDLALGSLVLGTSAVRRAVVTCESVLGPPMHAALRPPLLNPRLHPERLMRNLADRGRLERAAAARHAEALARVLVPRIASVVLDQLDLTAIVLDRVDLDALVAELDLQPILDRVDVDAVIARADLDPIVARLDLNRIAEDIDVDRVAERVDLDAIVDRLDIVALALWIIDSIDLPGIIRESTSSVASATMSGIRMQSIEADQAVSRVIDRILMRRRTHTVEPSWGPGNAAKPVTRDGAQQP